MSNESVLIGMVMLSRRQAGRQRSAGTEKDGGR